MLLNRVCLMDCDVSGVEGVHHEWNTGKRNIDDRPIPRKSGTMIYPEGVSEQRH